MFHNGDELPQWNKRQILASCYLPNPLKTRQSTVWQSICIDKARESFIYQPKHGGYIAICFSRSVEQNLARCGCLSKPRKPWRTACRCP